MDRIDASDKATGTSQYVADIVRPNMCFAAMARSTEPHARIVAIDTKAAEKAPGVIAVFTAADLSDGTFGRYTRDIPLLARDKVRYVGERVAAVVAETREQAEAAAMLVEVDYEPLEAVTTIEQAKAPGAVAVHDEPWNYPLAHVKQGDPTNLLAKTSTGSREEAEAALSQSAVSIDETYTVQSVHQGYLETQASLAEIEPSGKVKLWCTNKSPYMLRTQIGECLDIDPKSIDLQPCAFGGDFGGKGSPADAPICVELARKVGRPVKIVLRYSEDLTTTNPRHPGKMRVRMGADEAGNVTAVVLETELNGGAYAGYKPGERGAPGGLLTVPGYRIGKFYSQITSYFTNTVSRGNMRAPGSPQCVFAIESALDELAYKVGITPAEMRRRNLLRTGEVNAHGSEWLEHRGLETLDAGLEAIEPIAAPPGWLVGTGISLAAREDHVNPVALSLRLAPGEDCGVVVELSSVETGTGSHTAMRKLIADQLGYPLEEVEIKQVSSGDLDSGLSTGGSTVTVSFAGAAEVAAKAWANRVNDEPVTVDVKRPAMHDRPVGAYTVQIATVAVDPETGQVKVLEILTAADVAKVINEKAHQMQVDGGTVMGFGYACLEDLDESEGQVWAANLGEFKLPSERDVPRLRTVLLRGGAGAAGTPVKQIGESTTPPTAAAVANAVYDAAGVRIRSLPVTAERVYAALQEKTSAG